MTPDWATLHAGYALVVLAALLALVAAVITARREGTEWLAGALAAQVLVGVVLTMPLAPAMQNGILPVLHVLSAQAVWMAVRSHQHRRLQGSAQWGPFALALAAIVSLGGSPWAGGLAMLYSLVCWGGSIHALYRPQYVQPGLGTPLIVVALALLAVTTLGGSGSGDMAVGWVFARQIGWMLVAMGWLQLLHDRVDQSSRRLATMDPHTGAANRRTIVLALERDLGRAIRLREPVAVLMVGLDHFRQINERYGNPVGDEVLSRVASRLRGRLRAQDLVGRYGGDEFLVVLPSTDAPGAMELASQLCETVAVARHDEVGITQPVTVSIGVYGAVPIPGDRAELFIEAATRALFLAKQEGRNRVTQVGEMHTLSPAPFAAPSIASSSESRFGSTASAPLTDDTTSR